MKRAVYIVLILFFGIFKADYCAHKAWGADDQWQELKGKHFLLQYNYAQDSGLANNMLHMAEEYYTKIADEIGYARLRDFWTWEKRVKVLMFSDEEIFTRITHQPSWSRGFTVRHSDLFHTKVIITYKQEERFLEDVLPHEIAHLLLHDFIGFDQPIVLWFDEGVAQLFERNQDPKSRQMMAELVRQHRHVPFEVLDKFLIDGKASQQETTIFYIQSFYIVEFLIKVYGLESFRSLCRNLRDGKSFEEALRRAYYPAVDSMKSLEQKWLAYMVNN